MTTGDTKIRGVCRGLPVAAPVVHHPCMNGAAHESVARLHLPVAPRCNIRCHYCDRRISARVREACPGVAAAVLSPRQALHKTREFLRRWGDAAIVGIAGPGDPLANRETIETLALIRSEFPHARLCLCTNGLELCNAIDLLAGLGVVHLTVTINALDPIVAAAIHPWVRVGGRTITGRAAAELLIERQLTGVRAATSRGIHVKVNTVVVPGINGEHVEDVAREAAGLGVCVINLIPLLPKGRLASETEPSECYVKTLKSKCSQYLPVFDKCKRCRADAEGIPGREVAR